MTISWVCWCSEPRSQSHEHGHNFSPKNTPSAKMLLALCLQNLWAFAIHEYAGHQLCLSSLEERFRVTRQLFTSLCEILTVLAYSWISQTLTTFAEPLSPIMNYQRTQAALAEHQPDFMTHCETLIAGCTRLPAFTNDCCTLTLIKPLPFHDNKALAGP